LQAHKGLTNIPFPIFKIVNTKNNITNNINTIAVI